MSRLCTTTIIFALAALPFTSAADDPTADTELGQPLLLVPSPEPKVSVPGPTPTPVPSAPGDPVPLQEGESASTLPLTPYVPQTRMPAAEPAPPLPPDHPPQPVLLYPHVRIRSPHRAHPLGVPTVIPVLDPRDYCGVVYVEVCLPPCPCAGVRQSLSGRRVRLDYGRYSIGIISRRGVVIIDYMS